MNNGFSHLDNKGNARVVDISKKKKSLRYAKAQATVWLSKKILKMIKNDEFKKGNVINVARIAGIMGAKQTSTLIPLCHNITLEQRQTDAAIIMNNSLHFNILLAAKRWIQFRTCLYQ